MQIKYISPASANTPSLLRKTVAFMTMVALTAVVLMFSAMLLVVFLIVAVFGGAYLLWHTRGLRKQMQGFHASSHSETMRNNLFAGGAFEGDVIEGEAVRVNESRTVEKR